MLCLPLTPLATVAPPAEKNISSKDARHGPRAWKSNMVNHCADCRGEVQEGQEKKRGAHVAALAPD